MIIEFHVFIPRKAFFITFSQFWSKELIISTHPKGM